MTNWRLKLVHNFLSDVLRLNIMLWFEIHAGTRSLVAIQSFFWLFSCKQALLPTVSPDRAFPSFPFKCKLHTGQIRWNIHFFPLFLCPVFQLNSLLGHRLLYLLDCSAGIVKIIIWLTVMKTNLTALKQNPPTFLGSWVLISAMLCLKGTEFLRDAEADHDHSWKQCVCAYSPESQVELSCRAAGKDDVATLFVQRLLALWHFLGENVTYTEYEIYRE